jgi:hypothetical protein
MKNWDRMIKLKTNKIQQKNKEWKLEKKTRNEVEMPLNRAKL